VIASWNPQLMVDAHEMGANDTYLFTPPRHPLNPHLPPSHRKWWDEFASDQARQLDDRGYDYYTREWNEEFFPGYGSSWAAYRGALGILYEMSRTSGTWVKKRSGVTRTYPQAVEHQVASSIANLETLADNRLEILNEFVADRRAVIAAAGAGSMGAWVLPRRRNPGRTDRLVRLLREQGIEVLRSPAPRLAGLRDSMTGVTVEAKELGDCWAVPLDQPAAPMIRVLLDPHVPMNAEFLHEEREYLERGRGTRIYEVTSWSLLLSFGLEAYWTEQLPGEGWTAAPVDEARGAFEPAGAPYGWLIDGSSDASVRALADLLQGGIHVRVADRPFTLQGTAYDRGALLIQTEPNPENLRQTLKSIAEHRGVAIQAAGTAKAELGPDLGGSHFDTLVPPRVGIFTGYPISPTAYGALWHLMDRELELRFTALNIGRFRQADLRRYNVLIFPPAAGGARTYKALFGEKGLKQLKVWIDSGGTAIGVGSGSEFLADKEVELTQARLRRQALDRYPPVVFGTSPQEAMQAGPFRATGLRAEEPDADEAADKKSAESDSGRGSPYDVAPIVGPGAQHFAAGVDLGTPIETDPIPLAEWLIPFLPPDRSKPEPAELTRGDERLRRFSPRGAFVRVDLDPELWLTWGAGQDVPALVRAQDTLVAEPPVQVPARFAGLKRLQLGGLLWPEAAGRLAETAYATREQSGRGQVILFLNEPEFRGWTLATRRLLLNAVLYGPGLGTRWSSPW
jgi:hypothetical protein